MSQPNTTTPFQLIRKIGLPEAPSFWTRRSASMSPRAATSLLLLAALSAAPAAAQNPAPLILEATITLPHTRGRIDHMALDLRRGRLFVAELGNGTVDVVDLATRRVIHRLDGLHEPQGIAYAPGADIVAVASAGDGTVRFFAAEDLHPLGLLRLGEDADNVRIGADGRFVVGYGRGALAVIDPTTRSIIRQVPLPAHPEGFQLEGGSDHETARVNIPDAGQIAVLDVPSGRPLAQWRVRGVASNYPMALDPAARVLASVFRSPPRLALFNADSGAVRQTLETCGDADDVFFDRKRTRLYISCGAGGVAVLQGGDAYRPLQTVPTATGARTSVFSPDLDRLFVAKPAGLLGDDAALLVLRPQ